MTQKLKFLITGEGGREAAFASRLAEDVQLYAVMNHKNPSIAESVVRTGGDYAIANSGDPKTVLDFAKKHAVDYAFVNADGPLANGVIDALLGAGINAVGGTQNATRIEWDKIYSIGVMKKAAPEHTPFHIATTTEQELDAALSEFESRNAKVVVKPQGLTGGKGVKIMPEHLKTYAECRAYALDLFSSRAGESVLLVERLEGIEFTIMGITDGRHLVLSPASYDYPFRFEGDTGPGTGGMGCFTDNEKKLPFMTDQDMKECARIMQNVIDELDAQGHSLQGVLNAGFFKTAHGIKFMEFNARFGDPEGINILGILEGSFSEMIKHIWNGTLSESNVSFAKKASVVKYLVAKEYPGKSRKVAEFEVDTTEIAEMGVDVFFASCEKIEEHRYRTLKKSRVVAFSALAGTIQAASSMVDAAIDRHVRVGPLEYRRDIGSQANLDKLQGSSSW